MGQVTQNGAAPFNSVEIVHTGSLKTTQFVIRSPNAALTYGHGPFFSVLTDSA